LVRKKCLFEGIVLHKKTPTIFIIGVLKSGIPACLADRQTGTYSPIRRGGQYCPFKGIHINKKAPQLPAGL